ncbi:hypothetical protein PIB30_000025 [Stylosanthes scabra]|uniref:Uncharacterized protein n=1 Tax=Stylosanthes scabra TaxID=79078 RepID=A0ABU6Q2Y8_9FABA|nr:hypothetical protein [Stylosanthes scabra]
MPSENYSHSTLTQFCGLESSGFSSKRPSKIPKVENLEYAAVFNTSLQCLGGIGLSPAFPLEPLPQKAPTKSAFKAVRRLRKKSAPNKQKPCNIIPEEHHLLIHTTPAMGLTWEECSLAAYVFSTSSDYSPKEVLFSYKTISVRRDVLATLRLDVVPHSDVVNTAALISSLRAAKEPEVTCWFFPSAFAHEILEGKGAADIISFYTGGWMPPTDSLRHLGVMCEVFNEPRNKANVVPELADPNNWGKIHYPMTLPARLSPDETAVWCISWLLNDDKFSSSIFGNMGLELNVRMKAAMVIVFSEFNDVKKMIKLKGEAIWRSFPRHEAFGPNPH